MDKILNVTLKSSAEIIWGKEESMKQKNIIKVIKKLANDTVGEIPNSVELQTLVNFFFFSFKRSGKLARTAFSLTRQCQAYLLIRSLNDF